MGAGLSDLRAGSVHARARAEGVRVRARAVRRSGQGRRRTLRAGGRPTDRCVTLEPRRRLLSVWVEKRLNPELFLPSPPKELTNPPRRGSWPPPHAVPRRPTHAPATAPASPRQGPTHAGLLPRCSHTYLRAGPGTFSVRLDAEGTTPPFAMGRRDGHPSSAIITQTPPSLPPPRAANC